MSVRREFEIINVHSMQLLFTTYAWVTSFPEVFARATGGQIKLYMVAIDTLCMLLTLHAVFFFLKLLSPPLLPLSTATV